MKKGLSEICNFDFSTYDTTFLEKTIHARILANNLFSLENYIAYLNENGDELEILKKSLNNNFSEFFRNKLTFSYLEQIIFPELIQEKAKLKHKEIRIWSAACAAGQEPYSLAILCNEFTKSLNAGIRFSIFATDVSDVEVQKAIKGTYSESSLNNITFKRLNENFKLKAGSFTINNELKDYINFSTFDLLDKNNESPPASIFGSFDIVFCSNLLFYYSTESQTQILNKLDASLLSGGYLITGEAEKSIIEKNNNYSWIAKTSIARKPTN